MSHNDVNLDRVGKWHGGFIRGMIAYDDCLVRKIVLTHPLKWVILYMTGVIKHLTPSGMLKKSTELLGNDLFNKHNLVFKY